MVYLKRAEEGGGRREEEEWKKGRREREGVRDMWMRRVVGEEREGLLNHRELNSRPVSPQTVTEQVSLGRRQR